MVLSSSLFSAIVLHLVLAIDAKPTRPVVVRQSAITLPFALNLNTSGFATIPAADRARASAFIAGGNKLGKRGGSSIDVTNTALTYTASVGVGSPPTTYNLLIDTGSSNTWVGAGKSYVKTSTSIDTGDTVAVSYGSGSFSGEEFTDTVTLSDDLVIKGQSIGVANQSQGFQGVDGILGIGPNDLDANTITNQSSAFPTVTDNLFAQGTISSNLIGISYNPITTAPDTNGELTFGGTDSSKFTGNINFVPITTTSPASLFWGIDQSISSNGSTILATTSGIVDTGTTLVLIASDAFQTYQKQTGGVMDQATGLLKISNDQFNNLQSLFFNIGDQSYELTANAQIWPRSLNTIIGGDAGSIYLIVSDLGSNSGQGLDFVNGYTFLERFYSVFDTANSQVGFATTPHTADETN